MNLAIFLSLFHLLDSLVHESKECKMEINRLQWSWKVRHIVRHCRSNENRMSKEPSNPMLEESKREKQTEATFTSAASLSRHLHINLCKWGLCSCSFCLILPSWWKIILMTLFASCPTRQHSSRKDTLEWMSLLGGVFFVFLFPSVQMQNI